jgi:hypothetical protein
MGGFYVGECPRIPPFLKNNGASAPLFLRNGELGEILTRVQEPFIFLEYVCLHTEVNSV